MTEQPFGTTKDGLPVSVVRISADGIAAEIITLGATLHRFEVDGRNIVLGHPDVAGYQSSAFYTGATCGRYANRIGGAAFELDGVHHALAANENGNTLHGGPDGFDGRVWTVASITPSSVELTLTSPDGDQGFPGTVDATATYTISSDRLAVRYSATTDSATPINLTTHAYFNLDGEAAGDVDDQFLDVDADQVVAVGEGLIPTGELVGVDRRLGGPASGGVGSLAPLDDCFVVRGLGLRRHARLSSSDLALDVWSDQPGLQVYTGDALNPDVIGTSGAGYRARAGVALETQNFPDAPHHPGFPNSILRPGEVYRADTEWRIERLQSH